MTKDSKKTIAVLIPCYNEELTIKKVIEDFKKELPTANIYVYDNNSKDSSKEIAIKSGAIVVDEQHQGKGCVVRSMFRDIDADVYVMVDADDTYPADEVHKLIKPIIEDNCDMVIGDRLSSTYYKENKRPFHNFGNNLVRNLVNILFKSNVKDIMTGYRTFSKRFVKSMPVMSNGFEIETEMTVFSLLYHMNVVEIPITYRDRPEGSSSKLNTYKDGFKVLIKLFDLFKDNRPFVLFGLLSIASFVITIVLVICNKSFTASSTILSFTCLILFAVGIILDAIKNQKQAIINARIIDVSSKINK